MSTNRGHPWSETELQTLKSPIDEGRAVPEIAKLLDRSQEAVRRRAAIEGWYASSSLLYSPLPRKAVTTNPL